MGYGNRFVGEENFGEGWGGYVFAHLQKKGPRPSLIGKLGFVIGYGISCIKGLGARQGITIRSVPDEAARFNLYTST